MATSNPWATMAKPAETVNFADIMSEEYSQRLREKEPSRRQKKIKNSKKVISGLSYSKAPPPQAPDPQPNIDAEWEDCSHLLSGECDGKAHSSDIKPLETVAEPKPTNDELTDIVIAQMLQSEYDHEYNVELKRIEKKRNQNSKVTVTLDKFKRNGDLEFLNEFDDHEEEEDEEEDMKRDWDRFETNEKIMDTIPKCGFKLDKYGKMITKHDDKLCGVRNACRVMSFPPEFHTGDGAGFDMKLSNKVYNQLKSYSRHSNKKNKMHDRKEQFRATHKGLDGHTCIVLYKLINSHELFETIDGILSTGKEAIILHANTDSQYTGGEKSSTYKNGNVKMPQILPKECAIKVFATTLNEFKQRDRYIKNDYRFKDRFSKQNTHEIINMWAEKEMHNLNRMKSVGIPCPEVVLLKNNLLVMSFIGKNHNPAPKLKNANLCEAELSRAYEEIVTVMHTLYNEAKLVHADLSEYNILWYEDKCWFIDVAQAVEPKHPSALEFLMRDCGNIVNFFRKRGLTDIYSKEELFEYITSLNAEMHNVSMLERIQTRGATVKQATAPNQEQCPDEFKPLAYPFDLAWEKSQMDRQKQRENENNADSEQGANLENKHQSKIENTSIENVAAFNTASN